MAVAQSALCGTLTVSIVSSLHGKLVFSGWDMIYLVLQRFLTVKIFVLFIYNTYIWVFYGSNTPFSRFDQFLVRSRLQHSFQNTVSTHIFFILHLLPSVNSLSYSEKLKVKYKLKLFCFTSFGKHLSVISTQRHNDNRENCEFGEKPRFFISFCLYFFFLFFSFLFFFYCLFVCLFVVVVDVPTLFQFVRMRNVWAYFGLLLLLLSFSVHAILLFHFFYFFFFS